MFVTKRHLYTTFMTVTFRYCLFARTLPERERHRRNGHRDGKRFNVQSANAMTGRLNDVNIPLLLTSLIALTCSIC